MQMTPTIILGLALFACALTRVPDKYRPAWTHRLNSWQALIGMVAIILALLIVLNPEFYALGILGDSAFFDLLVLAISCQLQVFGTRAWGFFLEGFFIIKRFISLRICVNYAMMLFIFADLVSTIQKVMHRISS
jgi:uncharacterized membrane protein YkgB